MTGALEDFSQAIKRWWPTVLWMIIILYASTDIASPGNSSSLLTPIVKWLFPEYTVGDTDRVNFYARKVCHVLEFMILSFLVWRSYGCWKTPPRWVEWRLAGVALLIAAAFGISSEVIQRFTNTRGASVEDVLLDVGGALLGLVFIFLWKLLRFHRLPLKRPTRVLVTADLHLNREPQVLDQIRKAISFTKADVCVVAGDIATADEASRWLKELKNAVGKAKLVICLGNHDHWLDKSLWPQHASAQAIREAIWRPAAEAAGVTCLDFGNAEFKDLVICGGYGHYDLGMRSPTLEADGRRAELTDYQAGYFGGIAWNDMFNIPNAAENLQVEAALQAESIATRISEAAATGKSVLLVTHTLPFPELNAYLEQPENILHFFNAYAGNSMLSRHLEEVALGIRLAICGHTHAMVPLTSVRGIPCLNIGSDYGKLRFAVVELSNGRIEFPL